MMAENRARGGGSRGFNLGLGFVWGIPTGAILGFAPMVGLIFGALAAALLVRSAYRLWLAAGVLIGTGATYLAELAYSGARCREFAESSPLRDCQPPANIDLYQAYGLAILAVGLVLLAIAVTRRGEHRTTDGRSAGTTRTVGENGNET